MHVKTQGCLIFHSAPSGWAEFSVHSPYPHLLCCVCVLLWLHMGITAIAFTLAHKCTHTHNHRPSPKRQINSENSNHPQLWSLRAWKAAWNQLEKWFDNLSSHLCHLRSSGLADLPLWVFTCSSSLRHSCQLLFFSSEKGLHPCTQLGESNSFKHTRYYFLLFLFVCFLGVHQDIDKRWDYCN